MKPTHLSERADPQARRPEPPAPERPEFDASGDDLDPHQARPAGSALVRFAFAALGFVLIAIGAVGVVLPGLPTTPFLILAAACFLRSSQRLYDRVARNPTFGPAVRAFREGRGIHRRVRGWSIGLMWTFVAFALLVALPPGRTDLRVVVGAAAVIGTVYLMRLPTFED